MVKQPIGIFDSGYGGLTIMKEIVQALPGYDYIYLGDNARAPYGPRSFETVYHYTLECVQWLFNQGCPLIILACNTASAKALRTIQQNDLATIAPGKKVLGVLRPTTEVIGKLSESKVVGILATSGTVNSNSYAIEIEKFFPETTVYQEACPMWVPLIENAEHNSKGADYFVHKHIDHLLKKDERIDTLLLACTHYPLMIEKIQEFTPVGVHIITQGKIIAESLQHYLERHTEIEQQLTRNADLQFYTTDDVNDFNEKALLFYGKHIQAKHTELK